MWMFIQKQLLSMHWLRDLVGLGLSRLGLDVTGRVGGSIHFFLYDTVKITLLLGGLIFLISYIQCQRIQIRIYAELVLLD